MSTTVSASFIEFARRLNITDRQTTIVSNCHKNVVRKIAAKIDLHTEQPSLLIGSYQRDTLTRYLSQGDVDLMIVLHHGKNPNWHDDSGAAASLNAIKRILSSAYESTECGIDRNCVTMKLAAFRLDVVPAFKFSDGSYRIPDTYRGKWLPTNPIEFAKELTRINAAMDGSFVPLAKMIKAWNREYTKGLRSFHLECLLMNHYRLYNQAYTYGSMAKVFFGRLPSYLQHPTYDPISGDQVDLYLDNKSLGNDRDVFVKRALRAAALAEEALHDSELYPSVAIEEWKKLFGEFFPAYG
jgi:hypothetical protein